ncbi:glycosyl hydrolase family 18 protein [Francisella sp. 19S2-10]|uniref:glycosyl hydrolase family 18 protein n=1 Tax=unclassified Francisella TaxID=2610885 RepID=UPI003FA5BD35
MEYTAPKPAEEGSIKINANADVSGNPTTSYTLTDSDGNVVNSGNIEVNKSLTLDHIPSSENGVTYTLTLGNFTTDGYNYTPSKTYSVIVYNFNTSSIDVSFDKKAIPTENVTISVDGLPDGKSTTLTLANNNGDTKTIDLNSNSSVSTQIPKDGNVWTVTVAAVSGYKIATSPSSFTADQNALNISVSFEQQAPIEAGKKVIGYWENWKPGVKSGNFEGSAEEIAPYTHVLYSFLTLDTLPSPESPRDIKWNGDYINESMAGADTLEVMGNYKNSYDNNYNWQRVRIDSLINLAHENNGKFIWAIGGWSDLQQTISDNQIDNFVNQVIELLKLGGDGVDFDWEHLSQLANGKPNPNKDQQLATLAKTMKTLRERLDAEGMQDKQIGYTTRFNAFFESSKAHGFTGDFNSDGEGLAIEKWLEDHGSSLNNVVNWVNIMAYDVGPESMPNGETWTPEVFKDVLSSFAKYVNPNLVVLGFEPGGQAAGGKWEGMDIDKEMINYVADNNYGGSMFWAINQHAMGTASTYYQNVVTGNNVHDLANYSKEEFELE